MERERKSPNPFFCNCKSETNPPKSYPATSASRQIPHFVQHQYVCMYVCMYACTKNQRLLRCTLLSIGNIT